MNNRHGLSRNIPEPVKRQIRQDCGFGCVVCGGSIIEYEHIDPPFADAAAHDPKLMALLCPTCHQKVTSGMMSKNTVKEGRADPYCRRVGFSNQFWDIGKSMPSLVFGGLTLRNCPVPIQVKGIPLFEIKEGEEAGAPFQLSGNFFNSSGKPSLEIVNNEWKVLTSNWDVEVTGPTITVRDGSGNVSLRLIADPPGGLIVDTLKMQIADHRFIGNRDTLSVIHPNGTKGSFTNCIADGCRVGLSL
jgi:hypothetical protein